MSIRNRLTQVQDRISRAARAAGRDPDSVRLVVVTKGHPLEVLQEAIAAGARLLGENYVEEALAKIAALTGQLVEWHMIGHVQSRKAGAVPTHFALLHSLDSLKLARRLERFAGDAILRLPVLLECNLSGEPSKYGWSAWQEGQWEALLPEIEQILGLPHLEVRGLMTMAPYADDPELARPIFRGLRHLRDYLANHFPRARWDELSMGMSGDFEVAVQEGATLVRIGTAILGPRS